MLFFCFSISAEQPEVFKNYVAGKDVELTLFNNGVEDHNGFLWFTTAFDGGIARFDGYEFVFHYDDPNDDNTISSNHILDIITGPDGELLVSTWDGLNVLDPATMKVRTFRHDPANPQSLAHNIPDPILHHTGRYYWVGTPAGLSLLNIDSGHAENFYPLDDVRDPYLGNSVIRILQDAAVAKKLWLCTDSGLHSFNSETRTFIHFPCPLKEFSHVERTRFLLHDIVQSENALWLSIGFGNGGLLSFDINTERWLYFPYSGPTIKFDGRYDGYFNSILPDKNGNLLFTSNIGNGLFDLHTKKYQLFPTTGLDSTINRAGWTRYALHDRHGRVWWPGYDGICRSESALAQPNVLPKKVSVQVTGISINENHYQWPRYPEIKFPDNNNALTIQFALPNPAQPDLTEYLYQLEGFDLDWSIPTQHRTVTYQNLKRGKYLFKVKAKENQRWSEETILPIQVSLPIYKTWYFYLGIIGLLVLLFWGGFLSAKKVQRTREEKLMLAHQQKIQEVQLQALRAQMNPHFLFNSLNSIKYYAISKSKEETADYLSKFALLVRTILNNSKSHTISLQDEIEALKLYIEIEHLRLEQSFSYSIDIDPSLKNAAIKIPPLILQPFVENAIWHGLMHKPVKGFLKLEARDVGNAIRFIIEDNGIGREKSRTLKRKSKTRQKSMGIQITSDRIHTINELYGTRTQVRIEDLQTNGNASGTRVTIYIPKLAEE